MSSVSTDDRIAAKTAVDYLFSMGHEYIGILGGNIANSPMVARRYIGVKQSFEEHHIPFDEEWQYVTSHFSIADGYHAMEHLLDRIPEMTAVFAMSDVTAIGAIRAIHDRGLRVADDISVIGFDGIDVGRYMVPSLVTIRQYREVIAVRSVEILLNCIEGYAKSIYEVESFHLVPGRSVRAR